MIRVFIIGFIALLLGCSTATDKKEIAKSSLQKKITGGYDFNDSQQYNLTSSLREISGLSYADNKLYANNDEEGKVFVLDAVSGKTINTIAFGAKGDYEGVEMLHNALAVVKSNGDILFYDVKKEKTSIVKTKLKTENDVEGLCFYAKKNQLLLACKGKVLKGDAKNKEKAIYSYDIEEEKLNKNPFLTVKDKEVKECVEKLYKDEAISKKKFKRLVSRAVDFSPSGIAIHPKTKNYYIISAKGSTLMVFDKNKDLKDVVFLSEKALPQPEGICFDDKANLYISTESKGSVGRLYKYVYKH